MIARFSKPLTVALLAGVCLFAFQTVASAQEAVWQSKLGGRFVEDRDNAGRWIEYTHLKSVYHFETVDVGGEYVEIHDASRGVSIRLYDSACYIRHAGTGGEYRLLYNGAWTVRPRIVIIVD